MLPHELAHPLAVRLAPELRVVDPIEAGRLAVGHVAWLGLGLRLGLGLGLGWP